MKTGHVNRDTILTKIITAYFRRFSGYRFGAKTCKNDEMAAADFRGEFMAKSCLHFSMQRGNITFGIYGLPSDKF